MPLNLFAEARHVLERLLHDHDEPHYRSVDTGLRTYRGRHELASLLRQAGSTAESEKILRGIVKEFPNYLPASVELDER